MKIVGYITSDPVGKHKVAFSIQNRIIKEFVETSGKTFMLSWTEASQMAPWMLESLLLENFYEGICFFSLHQLLHCPDPLEQLQKLKEKNIWIGFAQEQCFLQGEVGFRDTVTLVSLLQWTSSQSCDIKSVRCYD